MQELEPESAAYNMAFAERLKGVLDQSALEATLTEIGRRHETLRTSFAVTEGQIQQIVGPPTDVVLLVSDLGHLPEAERLKQAHSIATEEARQPFELRHGPLYRARLLRLGDEDHLLLFTMHHIITDGWGLGVLLREVGTLYEAFANGLPSPLPPLPIQYADFAHWQRRQLVGEMLDSHLPYWQQRLSGRPAALELPTDRPRPAIQSFRGGGERLLLPAKLTEQLKAMARREGVTLFMLLLAVFKVLLHRYTGEEDIIIGCPIANRNRLETEGLIGFFVNMLVLRTDLSGSPTFRQLLARVRTTALEAYAHQDLPFEKLVEHLHPERSMSRHPLFQVMFQLGNAPLGEAKLAGLTFESIDIAKGTTQFDLSLDLLETNAGILTVAEYSTDLFDAGTIVRLLQHFQNLLEAVVDQPVDHQEQPIARLSMLTKNEREQLIYRWNDTGKVYPANTCLTEAFSAQVKRTPKAIAVDGAEQLTYEDLNHRANQLAHYLRGLGVGPEVKVGVLLERSVEMVVSLLAVLKADGAYLPLDPAYPQSRLSYLIADAQVSLVLTQRHLREAIPDQQLRIVCVDDAEAEAIAREDASDPGLIANAENLAYVIYTSGSTGRPKGVGVTHDSLLNHQAAVRQVYELGTNDRVLQFASLSFDVAAEEIFPSLLSGATVVLRDEKATGLSDLPNLLREVEERNITVLNLPASAWQECVVKLSAGSRLPDCLRLLIVGSEPVSRESFAVWQKAAGDRVRVLNAYGTTETTITATLYQPGAHDHEPDSGLALPIGRPLGNTRAYVLDRSLQPAPVGIPGELCIGGAGVSRGYLNYPEATGKSFIPDPFGNEPGSRLYRTGDLARFLPDGNIEFLGRADRQVKIRGYRIELGEVEAILKEHPGVRHAVVEPRQDFTGNNQLVGYIVAERDRTFARNELREFVKERLPEFMAPSVFVMMEELPLTSGGKVDRQALASHASHETVRSHSEPLHLPASRAERLIAKVWQELLQVETVDIDENFFDLGGHSLLMVRVHDRLREAFDKKLTMLDLFKYPTVRTLSAYLVTEQPPLPQVSAVMVETPKDRTRSETNEIAIVGMAGRFPGARSLDHFWQNLCAGVEAVNFYSDEELLAAGVDPSLLSNPNYVKAGVILEDIDLFDASFFGYSPREAEAMDPQHRLFLECAWEALEHAGHDPDQSGGSVGVFAGTGTGTYVYNLLSSPGAIEAIGGLQLAIGNDKDHLPTHVSYKLNLRGPSVAVQTACSASLTAVHMACRSVLAGECRMALAGGVAIHDLEKRGYLFQQGGIGSPDGHCRAFDAAAQGTISGSGVGIVVLKRLQDALADGDFIHAVIKGSAINNDGSAKVGYTAPSVEGQAEVIRAAQVAAGVSAEDITYIEAHGTGTRLGDPIEISALTQAFRASTDLRGFCAVGSLKTNIGHLDTAAGVAGLIKTVLALEHKVIPPSLHFDEPNPALDLDSSPFYVNKHLAGWQSSGGPRYAGVSSFGIGGTNAHVIVQEAPLVRPSGGSRPWQLLMLSAKSGQALDQATTGLVQYLKKHPETNLGDIAYTLQVGRKSFSHRRAVVCHKIDDALRTLELPDSRQLLNSSSVGTSPGVVFMFPGQGAQHVGMGLELYRHEIAFREQVDYCCEQLKQHLGFDLRDVLYPSEENSEEASLRLKQTSVTQPALFVVEYALARVWMGWGVKPRAMIGHSIGEYVAACLAGVMALEDALTLVALRGKLMQSLPEGTMLSVALSEDELRGLLGPQLSLAVINGPSLSVASGPEEAIAELQDRLTGMNVGCRRLVTSHAFHSQMMDPVLEEFRTQVARVKLNEPTIPYLSNLTGTWAQPSEVTEPGYWARHLRETVRFAAGARELLANGNGANSILLEVGPGRTLCSLVTGLARETGQPVINSLPPVGEHESGDQTVATALARLWLSGVPINWKEFYARETRHRLPLPTYPFERRRYWVDWQKPPAGDGLLDGSLRKQPDIADWFYLPYWKPSVLPGISGSAEQSSVWLVFLDALGFSQQVVTQLEKQGCEVITVKPGALFERLDDRTFIINVSEPKDYEALLLELKMLGKAPDNVLHALSLNDKADVPLDHERLEEALGDCFYSLIFLARALGQHAQKDNVTIAIMSNGVRRVLGDDRVVPEKATLLGPCSVIPQEYPFITCRSIDVALPGTRTWQESALVKLITSDLISGSRDSAVAYRANQRWTQAFEATRIQPIPGVTGRLRQGGVYLITGGLGGIGLEIARHLAKTVQAKLVLVGRSQLPWKNEWQDWLSTHTDNDETSNKIRRVLELEALGAEVLVASANVANTAEMQAALRQARERFGGVNGVIHSAGIAPGRLIQAEQDELAVNTLAPKVTGARVLEDLFKQEELDFLILFSSLSAILGAFGQVDYGAANAFLDAFAAYNIQQNGVPTVSINWDTWSETGMALRAMQSFNTGLNTTATVSAPGENGADHEEANQEELQSLIRDGMATVEGLEVFDRILAHDLMPQVIVSTRALQSVIKATEARTQAQIFDEMVRLQQAGPSYPRPDIQTAHVAPRNELEEQIAGIWESLLGIEGIGVDDNFFELGGHSLLATQLLSRLRETMSVDLPLRIIFEHPNVAALAKYVEQTWLEVVAAPPPIAKADRPSRRARRPRQT
jgi:amino acid adenylation domain-containing protein